MITKNWAYIVWTLLLLQLVSSRTVQHRRTTINANGERETKTWTSTEPDEDDFGDTAGSDDAEGFQTFTRDGATVRMKPQTQTIRIGGTNVPPERMIEQAALMKDLEPVAVRQLLNTSQPVTRTTFVDGVKRTSVYTLEPDGSIKCKIVTDIDPKQVDAAFEEIARRRKKLQSDAEQSETETIDRAIEQKRQETAQIATDANKAHMRQTFETRTHAELPQPTLQSRNNFEDPQLPTVWDPKRWPQHDPFNPPDLPAVGQRDNDAPFDERDTQTPSTLNVLHSTQDGTPLRSTYHMGPNEWTRHTISAADNAAPPLQSHYETTTVRTSPRYQPAASYDKPIRTIDINELPVMSVLNNGQPVDAQFLRNYPADLLPPSGDKPIRTLKIENIPESQDVETTKVKTISRTLTSDHVPTNADLDPSMQEILRRAGINPEEVTSSANNTITRVRVEPDGRIIKTTYRMRKLPVMHSNFGFNDHPLYGTHAFPSSTLDDEWPSTFSSRTPTSTHGFSGSRNGVEFPTFSIPSTTPAQAFDEDAAPKTLNPLHMHHIDGNAVSSRAVDDWNAPSAIEEFLSRIGMRVADIDAKNGELVKTIVDRDGRTLSARFVLSPRMPAAGR